MRRELCCAHDLASVASARFSLKSNERQRDLLTLASSHVDFASSLLPWLPALPNDRPTHDRCAPAACSERQSCIAIPTSSRYSSRCPKQLITSPTLSVHGSPDPGYLHYLHTHTHCFLPSMPSSSGSLRKPHRLRRQVKRPSRTLPSPHQLRGSYTCSADHNGLADQLHQVELRVTDGQWTRNSTIFCISRTKS